MTDEEIRDSLRLIYEEATRTWYALKEREKRMIGGDKQRAKQVRRAWDLNNKAWALYRDYLNEGKLAP